jgi:hypothetical protein
MSIQTRAARPGRVRVLATSRRRVLSELVQLVFGESGYSRRRDVSRSRAGWPAAQRQVYLKMVSYRRVAWRRSRRRDGGSSAWCPDRSERTGKPTCSSDFGCVIAGWFSGSCPVFFQKPSPRRVVVLVIA